jgi:Phage tail tube protein
VPYASGLSAQLGMKAESTYGTAVTVDRFYEILSTSLNFQPTYLDSAGLKAGQAFKRVARTQISRYTVGGDIVMEHTDGGVNATAASMGTWWKYALGSTFTTPVQIAASTAYRQTFVPGSKAGQSLTVQVGKPQILSTTVNAHTYTGVVIPGWEFTCSDGELAKLSLTCSGQNESTAIGLAAASYPNPNGVFSFADTGAATGGVFTLGGTPTTAAGRTTVAGGVAVASLVKGITIRGETPMADERYGLGTGGSKGVPIENDIPTITGSLDTEYYSRAELYDLFKGNVTTCLQLDFAHGDAGTSNPFRLSFVMSAIKLKSGEVSIDGPDVLGQTIEFEAYDDGTNPPLQVELVSKQQTTVA